MKIFARSAGGLIVLAGMAALGGWCWLYSWSWGAAPALHDSFSPAETGMLLEMDAQLSGEEAAASAAAGAEPDCEALGEQPDNPMNAGWCDRLVTRLCSDIARRKWHGAARCELHRLMATGRAAEDATGIALEVLRRRNLPLVRLLVTRGVDPDRRCELPDAENTTSLLLEAIPGVSQGREYLPVAERLDLLAWLVEQGADIHSISHREFILLADMSMLLTDDTEGRVAEWFLRRGFNPPAHEVIALLLRHPGAQPVLQLLVQENILPPVPPELKLADGTVCTPLQYAVCNIIPSPQTVLWLLDMGHDVNAVAAGAQQMPDTPVGDSAEESSYTPLDSCLNIMKYADAESDARLRDRIRLLDILLQHGARPTDRTRDLLPVDNELMLRVLELFQQHGHYLMAGDSPCNACCS